MNSPFMGAVEKVAGGRRWCVQPLNNLAKRNMSRYRAVRLNDGILKSESLQMGNYMADEAKIHHHCTSVRMYILGYSSSPFSNN
jgi:hypothetical protein